MTRASFSRRAWAALVTTVLILPSRYAAPQEPATQAVSAESGATARTLSLVRCDDNKVGFIDQQGKVRIPCRFDDAHEFSNGLAAVGVLNPLASAEIQSVAVPEDSSPRSRVRWGFIDETGTLVIPIQFPFVQDFSENMAAAQKEGEWGFIDRNGLFKVPPRYDEVGDFHEGAARVESGIGRKGPGWSWRIMEGVTVTEGVHWGFIDREGKLVVPEHYSWLSDFDDGLAAFHEGAASSWPSPGHEGHLDHSGVRITEKGFDFVGEFSEGLACVTRKGKEGYIDRTGNVVIAPQFDDCGNFSEGLAEVRLPGGWKWGYVDKNGKLVIAAQFDRTDEFHQGLAIAAQGTKYGFIARDGRWVVQPQYDSAHSFRNGLARVGLDHTGSHVELLIDQTGRCVWNCQQAERVTGRQPATDHSNNPDIAASDLFMVRQGGKNLLRITCWRYCDSLRVRGRPRVLRGACCRGGEEQLRKSTKSFVPAGCAG